MIERCSQTSISTKARATSAHAPSNRRREQDLAGASSDFVQAQNDLLDALGLAELAWTAKPEDLLEAMKRDKKARGGRVRHLGSSG